MSSDWIIDSARAGYFLPEFGYVNKYKIIIIFDHYCEIYIYIYIVDKLFAFTQIMFFFAAFGARFLSRIFP